jgi:hypothetical protein
MVQITSFISMRYANVFGLVLCLGLVCGDRIAGHGQENAKWSGLGIEANLSAGKVVKHTVNFRAPVPDLSTAVEINFMQQTYGKKAWHQRRHFPRVGVGMTYTNYGIDSIYGQCIGLYPNIEFPLVKGRQLEWTVRMGFGVGYVTRHFERAPVWDTLNNAISTHFNNFTMLSTDLRYHVNNHWAVQMGVNFSHISNAGLRQPNLGINMLGGHLGVRYYPVTSRPERIIRELRPLKNRWLAQARLGLSFNETTFTDGPMYPIYLASVYASKRWKSKNKMFIGMDYSYHKDIEAFLKNNEIEPGQEKQQSWKSAVFVGNEFLFGRVGVMLQVGYYVKQAVLKLDPYYEKLGCNFYIVQKEKGPVKELFLSILLKTHKTQAELAELGVGIGI